MDYLNGDCRFTVHARLYLAVRLVPILTIFPSLIIFDRTLSTVFGETSIRMSQISDFEIGTRDPITVASILSVLLFFLGTTAILRLSSSFTLIDRMSMKYRMNGR